MRKIRLSERALGDLLDIRDWIAEVANTAIAEAYVTRIREKMNRLADFPDLGEPQPQLKNGTRKLTFERNYIIFYRVEDATVKIDRVISGRRDIASLF